MNFLLIFPGNFHHSSPRMDLCSSLHGLELILGRQFLHLRLSFEWCCVFVGCGSLHNAGVSKIEIRRTKDSSLSCNSGTHFIRLYQNLGKSESLVFFLTTKLQPSSLKMVFVAGNKWESKSPRVSFGVESWSLLSTVYASTKKAYGNVIQSYKHTKYCYFGESYFRLKSFCYVLPWFEQQQLFVMILSLARSSTRFRISSIWWQMRILHTNISFW